MPNPSANVLIGIVAAVVLATPAFGDAAGPLPGYPCVKNNGNSCNGNNGRFGYPGSAGGEQAHIYGKPPPIQVAMPPVFDRDVFISQIGVSNQANVVQTAPNANSRIDQNGDSNDADVSQRGLGSSYIAASQLGHGNFARVEQSGIGQDVASVSQTGNGNWLWSYQEALGAVYNGARLSQTGNNNDMALDQSGADNVAVLTQNGDGNGMTAIQAGVGNRLTWTQTGNNLTDLNITQTGGSASTGQLLITQTNIASGH